MYDFEKMKAVAQRLSEALPDMTGIQRTGALMAELIRRSFPNGMFKAGGLDVGDIAMPRLVEVPESPLATPPERETVAMLVIRLGLDPKRFGEGLVVGEQGLGEGTIFTA